MNSGRVSSRHRRRAWLGLLGFAFLGAVEARAQCTARIQAVCDEPTGDTADCAFSLQTQAAVPAAPVTLTFAQDPSSYEVAPAALALAVGQVASARVTVRRTPANLGLVQLRGTATGLPPECAKIALPLDFLEPDTLRVVVRGTSMHEDRKQPPPDETLRLGHVEQIELAIADSAGQAVRLPVPLTLLVNPVDSSAEIGTSEGDLHEERPTPVLLRPRQSSELVLIRPLRPGTGRLRVEVKLDQSARTLAATTAGFRTEQRQGHRMGLALLGGFAYWVLTLPTRLAGGAKTLLLALLRTLVACGVGFFLQAQLPLWGFAFRADPTQLGSQFVLGVVLAGLGTEGLLGLIRKGGGTPRGGGSVDPGATGGG
jgi:hypothetical protein